MTDHTELIRQLKTYEDGYGLYDAAADAIDDLQAQLPKRGEWKPFDLTYGRSIYSCSVCEQATEVPMCIEKPMYAYCPNCGAKMIGEQNVE